MTLIIAFLSMGMLGVSMVISPKKTTDSLRFSLGMLRGMALQLLSILALIALLLTLIPPDVISRLLGSQSQLWNIIWGALLGTVTILPGIIAFPLAGNLVLSGASIAAVAAFITTLTMVGFATMPLEIQHFGRRFTLVRNGISFLLAIVIAILMGVLL